MNTRLILAVLTAAIATTGCDQSAGKPKAAGHSGGGLTGPRSASAAPISAVRPDNSKPTPGAKTASTSPKSAPANAAETIETPAEPLAPAAEEPAAAPEATPTTIPEGQPPQDGVLKHTETDSGLIIDDLKFGTGVEAKPHQTVTMNCRGTLADGREFYSTYTTGQPATFGLDTLVKGWQEGVPGMKIGGKRRLIVPPELGYGKREIKISDQMSIPPNSMLIFEIELLGVK